MSPILLKTSARSIPLREADGQSCLNKSLAVYSLYHHFCQDIYSCQRHLDSMSPYSMGLGLSLEDVRAFVHVLLVNETVNAYSSLFS